MPNVILIDEVNRRAGARDSEGDTRERTWLVRRQDTTTGQIIAMSNAEVWSAIESTVDIGSEYPGSPGLKCDSIDPEEDEDTLMWDVNASYKIPDEEDQPDDFDDFMNKANGDGADNPENPFGPEFSGGGQTVEEYWWTDLDEEPFVNCIGSAFQNIPAIPVTIQVDRVTVSERNKPNTAAQGMAAGRYLLANVSYQYAEHVDRKTGKRTRYYRNTYERWTHPYRDWAYVWLLNMGFVELKDGELEVIKVKDPETKKMVPTPEARGLSAAGAALPPNTFPSTKRFRIRIKTGSLGIPFLG